MTWNGVRSLLVISCLVAFVTVGCGQGSPLSSSGSLPTIVGPTALTADAPVDVAGSAASLSDPFIATDRAKDRGKQKDKGNADDEDRGKPDDDEEGDDDNRRGPNRGRGSLSGFVTAVTPTSLTLRGVVVTVPEGTEIRHGYRQLSMADIQVGDHVQVKGTAMTTVTGTTFIATEIKVEDMDEGADDDAEDDDADDADAKIGGMISGLTSTITCPALTFNVVSGTPTTPTTTQVTTNAQTKFDDVLCTALANDAVVEVKGTKQTDGSILATKVELEN